LLFLARFTVRCEQKTKWKDLKTCSLVRKEVWVKLGPRKVHLLRT
jgi:hypothetical protein